MRTIDQAPGMDLRRVEPESELDVGAVGRALWRKKLWLILPALLVCALTFVGVNMITPRFKSEARVLLEGRENVFLRPEAEKLGDRERALLDAEAVTSQVQVMLSRDLARQVIAQNKLDQLPEFDPMLRGTSSLKQALISIGLARDPTKTTAEERVLEAYYDRIAAFSIDKSRVIAVEFQSHDPDLAARVTNSIVENFLRFQQTSKQDSTRAATTWLSQEIETLRKRVAEAEQKVEDFRGRSNLLVGTNNTTLTNQGLGELNTQLGAARAQRADADAKAKLLRDMLKSGQPLEASELVNSDLIRRLSEQRVILRAQLAEQSSTLLDGHPRIKELRAQIGDLERQIRSEAEKVVRSLEHDARVAGAREETLRANLDALKKQVVSTNEQDVQLRALEREARAQRDLLENYLARYREASARENMGTVPAEARVISGAIASSTPFFPKKGPIVAIATLATLLLTIGFITTGELLGGNVYRTTGPVPLAPAHTYAAEANGRDLVAQSAAAASLPAPSLAPAEDAGNSVHPLAALVREKGSIARRVTVATLGTDIGTAETALSLARSLGSDSRVVLVDLALANPTLSVRTTDANAAGVGDLVSGAASFGQIIQRDRGSQVHIVSAGRVDGNVETVLGTERLTIAIDALAQTYDYVVVDAGMLSEAMYERFARFAPWLVLVARPDGEQDMASAETRLLEAGFKEVTPFPGVDADSEAGLVPA